MYTGHNENCTCPQVCLPMALLSYTRQIHPITWDNSNNHYYSFSCVSPSLNNIKRIVVEVVFQIYFWALKNSLIFRFTEEFPVNYTNLTLILVDYRILQRTCVQVTPDKYDINDIVQSIIADFYYVTFYLFYGNTVYQIISKHFAITYATCSHPINSYGQLVSVLYC